MTVYDLLAKLGLINIEGNLFCPTSIESFKINFQEGNYESVHGEVSEIIYKKWLKCEMILSQPVDEEGEDEESQMMNQTGKNPLKGAIIFPLESMVNICITRYNQ